MANVTPPVAGSEISAATFGIPVANEINALQPTAWVNLAIAAPWVNVGGARASSSYRKRGVMVDLRVSVNNGAAGGTAIAQLPVGFRPTFTVDLMPRDGAAIPGTIINILSNGDIMCYLSTQPNANTLVSFIC